LLKNSSVLPKMFQ